MIYGKKVLAIIPARGGSKRLPRKNILPLVAKPLIGWTIEAAKNSCYIDDIFVSTDNEEIVDAANQFDVNVPELRPVELSTDTATTKSVLCYTLNKYRENADIVVLLQPTSPCRTHQHIDEAIELFHKKSAFSIISVTPCEHPPQWSNSLPENHSMNGFLREDENKRSQDLSKFYRLNGAIYVYDVNRYLSAEEPDDFNKETFAYIMDNEDSVDIDTKLDFNIAGMILKSRAS